MNNMMVKEHEMKNEIYKYIADSVNCTVEQLKTLYGIYYKTITSLIK